MDEQEPVPMDLPEAAQEVAAASWSRQDYFTMGGKKGDTPQFAPAKMGAALLVLAPAAKDEGGRLYAYHDNAWRAGGEEFYRRMIRERMGDRWLPRHATEVVTWIEHGAPKLDPAPPPDRIRVLNGILRLADGGVVLDPPSVDPLTPVQIPVIYDPKAKCPAFRKFMREVLSPDLEKIAQEIMGYLLTPDNSQQKAILAQGEGGNGKSVWVNVCGALIGRKNYSAYPLHAIGDNRFAAADLYGKLANLCADISADELSSSALFRSITGGDPIPAEHKFRNPFTFTPYARMIFSANKYPPIANPTNALFDRWVVLPFRSRFRGTADEDKHLLEKLTTPQELSGILNYALAGLFRLQANGGFSPAQESREALESFRLAADVVAAFIKEMVGPGFHKRSDLFQAYKIWCGDSNHSGKMSRNAFYERVRAVLGTEVRPDNAHGWRVE